MNQADPGLNFDPSLREFDHEGDDHRFRKDRTSKWRPVTTNTLVQQQNVQGSNKAHQGCDDYFIPVSPENQPRWLRSLGPTTEVYVIGSHRTCVAKVFSKDKHYCAECGKSGKTPTLRSSVCRPMIYTNLLRTVRLALDLPAVASVT